ncbi:MAG TPA: endo-1,3-alpha-glucanase family glycosylhydrolase [Anaerolineales bacterium]|nr:endo-1,3-alpha-glucanase family glycosylhydrolase [Anaerolineales bacterium]
MRRRIASACATWLAAACLTAAWPHPSLALAPSPSVQTPPIPLLAYYYIWFDPGSWDRAKSDLPLLGSYSSSDPEVMRRHVQWAKEAGIDGFIVSWKSTDTLNARLESLVSIASEEDFSLAIIYQGLDFERDALPVDRVVEDLKWFVARFGGNPVFQLFGKPLVIWSGTWEFSDEEIALAARELEGEILFLASERQVDELERRAQWVDGNAYYWSSVDPFDTPRYEEKLTEMGEVVHRFGGLWIAPAAPGFDARLIGGSRIVERNDGDTLRSQMAAALASSADAVGLISWNEFSENSHVEPSRNYGARYLEVLAELRGGQVPDIPTFDSDEPAATVTPFDPVRLAPFLFLGSLALGSLVIILFRRVRR